MKKLIILCGLPRSGKSTWVKNNKTNEVVISADDLRYLVYNQRYWQEGESLMWSIREIMLKSIMQQGLDIIIDETNTTKKRREPIVKLAKKYGYYIVGNIVETDPEICRERVRREDNWTGDKDNEDNFNHELLATINRMEKQFELPQIEEGFNELNMI